MEAQWRVGPTCSTALTSELTTKPGICSMSNRVPLGRGLAGVKRL